MTTERDGEVVRIVPGKSDADVAAAIKAGVLLKLTDLCKIVDEANAAGFQVGFGIGHGPLGKQMITQLIVAKHF